jgi:hypothetical protein
MLLRPNLICSDFTLFERTQKTSSTNMLVQINPHPYRSTRRFTRSETTWNMFQIVQLFILFLLIVGNPVCLVLLCLIPMRRDKVCPQYRVRNWDDTNHPWPPQKPSGPLENSSTISLPKIWGEMTRYMKSYSRNTGNGCTLVHSNPSLCQSCSVSCMLIDQ